MAVTKKDDACEEQRKTEPERLATLKARDKLQTIFGARRREHVNSKVKLF